MVISDIEKRIAIGKDVILYSKSDIRQNIDLKVRYRINPEEKEIRLYDMPQILSFQDKAIIYYAILDKYYFLPLCKIDNEYKNEKIEEYIVKENGYTYHQFYSIEGQDNGLLGELLFEIPRQEVEPEKLSKLRDIYEMLVNNVEDIGSKPICININGVVSFFKDAYNVIKFMIENDSKLKQKKDECIVVKRGGIFKTAKMIYILPKKLAE